MRYPTNRRTPVDISRKGMVPLLVCLFVLVGAAMVLDAGRGFMNVWDLLGAAGWGLLWLVPLRWIAIGLDSLGWYALLRCRGAPIRPFYLVWAAGVREAVGNLMPVIGPAGVLVGVRLVMLRRVAAVLSLASVVVEGTITLFSQFLFVLTGMAIFLYELAGHYPPSVVRLLLVLGIVPVLVVALVLLQRRSGVFERLDRWLKTLALRTGLPRLTASPRRLHRELLLLYRVRRTLALCSAWQIAGLFVGTLETVVIFHLFGDPVGLGAALVVESLGRLVRSAAFMLPGGLGAQEAAFAMAGQLIGVGPDGGLALALAKRFRELAFGVPLILSWQWVEGRRLWTRPATEVPLVTGEE